DNRAILAALAGLEDNIKDEPDLLPQAVKLRLEAYPEVGDFAAARQQLQQHGAVLAKQFDAHTIEDLAVGYIRAGARDKANNDAAQQVALALYELLPAEGDAASRNKLTLARL